jgi:hypothetical protein
VFARGELGGLLAHEVKRLVPVVRPVEIGDARPHGGAVVPIFFLRSFHAGP